MVQNRKELVQQLYSHATGRVILATATDKGFPCTYFNPRARKKIEEASHLCVSTLGGGINKSGNPSRSADNIHEVCLLALDDVGTKAKQPMLKPTMIVETSPDNFTYVYKYARPVDKAQGETIIQSMIAAGYCDPGSGGTERLFRLPDSQPPGKQMSALVSLDDVEYDPDEILTLFDVAAVEAVTTSDYTPTPAPYPITDEVAVWLGLTGDDWQPIPCPWADEHTDDRSEAKYKPASQDDIRRHFKCHHSHGHTTEDFLAWVAEQGGPNAGCEVTIERNINDLFQGDIAPAPAPTMRRDINSFAAISAELGLSAQQLPDIRMGTKGPAAVQKASPVNVQWITDQAALKGRLNMMTHQAEYETEHAGLVIQQLAMDCSINGPAAEKVFDALPLEQYHPAEDWFNDLPTWDGVDRFPLYARMWDGSTMTETYLRKFFLQTIQAACGWRNPQQIPHVLILCGPQGIGKTTWVENLCPFTKTGASLHLGGLSNVDSIRQATSDLIVELGEFETTYRKSEQGDLKNFLSRSEDTYRNPYGKLDKTMPRTTVYVASVNTMDVLRDPTGSRRYWPLEVNKIPRDFDLIPLWSQAKALWDKGETYFLTEEQEDQRIIHSEAHRAVSEVEEAIGEAFPSGFFTAVNGVMTSDTVAGISMRDLIRQSDLRNDKLTRSEVKLFVEMNGGHFGRISCPITKRRLKYGTLYHRKGAPNVIGSHLSLVPEDE